MYKINDELSKEIGINYKLAIELEIDCEQDKKEFNDNVDFICDVDFVRNIIQTLYNDEFTLIENKPIKSNDRFNIKNFKELVNMDYNRLMLIQERIEKKEN